MMGNVQLFLIRSGIIVKIRTCSPSVDAFCAELRLKQVSYRISVPMSYISCLSLPLGAKIHEKQQMRIQEGHFLKTALNLVLTLPDHGECRTFFDSPRNY